MRRGELSGLRVKRKRDFSGDPYRLGVRLAGVGLTIDGHDNIKVNKAHINAADIGASNGVIHVIDTVLMPPKA